MVLIKTKNFERKMKKDIEELKISKRTPLWYKGSYENKPIGSYVTDIDFTALVYYNKNLVDKLPYFIKRMKSFLFINMVCGTRIEYETPWVIDNEGGCNYDQNKVDLWIIGLEKKKLLPSLVLQELKDKFKKDMTLQGLVEIYYLLEPFRQIVWTLKDLEKGYIKKDNEIYYLHDVMKKAVKNPVMKFLYSYKDPDTNLINYTTFDLGLVDKNYKKKEVTTMYKYYMNDWYKVMKSYRWKIKDEYKLEYNKVMKKIELLSALRYSLSIIDYMNTYKMVNQVEKETFIKRVQLEIREQGIDITNKSLKMTNRLFRDLINKKLESHVIYFKNKIQDKFQKMFNQYYERGLNNRALSVRQLRNSNEKCPFFEMELEDYLDLVSLSERILLQPDKLIECFKKVARERNISVKNIVKIFNKNPYYIEKKAKEILLKNVSGETLERYSLDQLNMLQNQLLLM